MLTLSGLINSQRNILSHVEIYIAFFACTRTTMVPECAHTFVEREREVYVCTACGVTHECGAYVCDHTLYNSDQTKVCSLTGVCFTQKLCDKFSSPMAALNEAEPVYAQRHKRDQQIRNRYINVEMVEELVNALVLEQSVAVRAQLCSQIVYMWQEYIDKVKHGGRYTHRKDKRCFVVAIIQSLRAGFKLSNGTYIIAPHPGIKTVKLNKKNNYLSFKVTDVRYGLKMIRAVFKKSGPKNIIEVTKSKST